MDMYNWRQKLRGSKTGFGHVSSVNYNDEVQLYLKSKLTTADGNRRASVDGYASACCDLDL